MSNMNRDMNYKYKVKRARNKVETKLLLFGPKNITSILDKETFATKLQDIATAAETYLEVSEEILQDLEDLKEGGEEYYEKLVEEIKSDREEILSRVRENEYMVKRKVEEIMKQEDMNKYRCNEDISRLKDEVKEKELHPTNEKVENHPIKKENMTKFVKNEQEEGFLLANISEYCEDGPFLTHLPEFRNLVKFVINQFKKKLPGYG